MIYFLYGAETYRTELSRKKITEGTSVCRFDTFSKEVEEMVMMPSVMGEVSVILSYETLGAEEKLLQFLNREKKKIRNNFLIVAGNVRSNTKLYKWLMQNAEVMNCNKLTRTELSAYLLRGVSKLDCKITENAMNLLIDRSGYLEDAAVDLFTVNILLRQCAFAGKEIVPDTVNQVVSQRTDDQAWDLIGLITGGNREEGMRRANELADTSQPIMILGLLFRNYRIAYKCTFFDNNRAMSEKTGLSMSQIAKITGMFEYDIEAILKGMEIIMEETEQIKKGLSQPRTALIRAIGKLFEQK